MSNTSEPRTRAAISTIWRELIHGAPPDAAWVLNPTDPGLLQSLVRLSAEEASRIPPGHYSSVAAHVRHVAYGLSLLNRWVQGENPFSTADWSTAWREPSVSDTEWTALRAELEARAVEWAAAIDADRALSDDELTGVIGSVVHLAYHLGAIRQIVPAIGGPRPKIPGV